MRCDVGELCNACKCDISQQSMHITVGSARLVFEASPDDVCHVYRYRLTLAQVVSSRANISTSRHPSAASVFEVATITLENKYIAPLKYTDRLVANIGRGSSELFYHRSLQHSWGVFLRADEQNAHALPPVFLPAVAVGAVFPSGYRVVRHAEFEDHRVEFVM